MIQLKTAVPGNFNSIHFPIFLKDNQIQNNCYQKLVTVSIYEQTHLSLNMSSLTCLEFNLSRVIIQTVLFSLRCFQQDKSEPMGRWRSQQNMFSFVESNYLKHVQPWVNTQGLVIIFFSLSDNRKYITNILLFSRHFLCTNFIL